MDTVIEKDSPGPALLLIFVVILLLAGGGCAFAYMNGAFGQKTTLIEYNKTVENKTVVVSPEHGLATPAAAPEQPRPAQPAPANP